MNTMKDPPLHVSMILEYLILALLIFKQCLKTRELPYNFGENGKGVLPRRFR
jgi:hypothetical protein